MGIQLSDVNFRRSNKTLKGAKNNVALKVQPTFNAQSVIARLAGWEDLSVAPRKPPVPEESLVHRALLQGEFWRGIPGYEAINTAKFLDHKWQATHSVTNLKRLRNTVGDLVPEKFYADVQAGLQQAPMSLRVSPYLISLIDWSDPYSCPIRTQFIPVGPGLEQDHPQLSLDSLHEQKDSPVAGLTHRYGDKALFLPLDTCPVYCRFCTRSYSIGLNTDQVKKVALNVNIERWRQAFAYIASRPELEDIVISGGDCYNLQPKQLEAIGMTLLGMSNIRRIRFATKGLAVMPQKIISDTAWVNALSRVVDYGRRNQKEVVVHTHFNHPAEITWISHRAMSRLFRRGITVRNQSVLQRGVNDNAETMTTLVRRLSYINVQPYYVYLCDMVKGIEGLRTSVAAAQSLEKHVRGSTAGFNTPTFVCDAPGGGGKREIHSHEFYDAETGVAVYTAPSVKPGQFFLYFDPLHSLSESVQARWLDVRERQQIIDDALDATRACMAGPLCLRSYLPSTGYTDEP